MEEGSHNHRQKRESQWQKARDWRGVRILSILTPWKESSSSILLSANPFLFDVIEIFVEVSQLSYVRLGLIFEYPLLQPWPCWNSPSCQIDIFIARMKDKLTLTACGPMIAWRSAKGVNIVMNSFPPLSSDSGQLKLLLGMPSSSWQGFRFFGATKWFALIRTRLITIRWIRKWSKVLSTDLLFE